MSKYYVALTGSKNNAGDFLIKHRATQLLSSLRPDRGLVDMNGWEPLGREALATVNGAQALLLLGGPALQPRMHPDIFPLSPSLDDIRVPIVAMGIGWKHPQGAWSDTRDFPLGEGTLRLLRRVEASGHASSVRDFHSLNVLHSHGIGGFVMSGCPATYDPRHLGQPVAMPRHIGRVAFSLGVSFVRSGAMERQMKDQVLRLRGMFPDARFEVVFHHSLDEAVFRQAYPDSPGHLARHLAFARWLDARGIARVDISGGVEKLVDYYDQVDLHVGYRVHAHLFMASQSRLSLLIAEDGRGRAIPAVLGGMVVDAAERVSGNRWLKALAARVRWFDAYRPNAGAWPDVAHLLQHELTSGGQRTAVSRAMIDQNFRVMQRFIEQLP